MSEESITRRVWFSGRVQGVGFRWTVEKIAGHLPVTGFVRNLRDGRVELTASGTATILERLLTQISDHFTSNITAVESEQVETPENFVDFRIRR
ncbi:MAG: acylphosphatase [Fuerstiella sp.]|nr:acylphosphatase [Fuerstiella sp.]